MTDHPRTEAAELSRIILADSEADRPMDLYTLNVGEARTLARAAIPADTLVDPLDDHHPAVQAAAHAALAEGWTCDTHEPLPWGECRDCTESHLRTARRALTAALPHLTAATRDARAPEPLPCGCENPLNAVHLLDH